MITDVNKLLFIDIETVPVIGEFLSMDPRAKELYEKKFRHECKENEILENHWAKNAGLHAEFSRVLCVSMGFVRLSADGEPSIKLKTLINNSERKVLEELAPIITPTQNDKGEVKELYLVAHNGKEFDFPFLGKRYLINGLRVPSSLMVMGKKPWDIGLLDTKELWKFGQYKGSISLDLLCHVFGIDSPKGEMDGSKVAGVFYANEPEGLPWDTEEKRFKVISDYCEGDIVALASVYLKMVGIQKPINKIIR